MTAEFVLSELQSVGSPEKAAHLSRFFKTGPGQYGEGDRFLGVVVPQTRSIAKANKAMPLDELQRLLDSPWHEARLCALLVLVYRFQDKKTPEAEREKMWIIADGDHAVWIMGLRISEAYKITGQTTKIVEIKVKGEKADGR